MNEILTLVLGLAAGVVGYFFTTFWMEPILHYRRLRHEVISDLIFYRDAINFEHGSLAIRKRAEERSLANRRHGAELIACYHQLPKYYRRGLRKRGVDPSAAAVEMLGLSNIWDWAQAEPRVRRLEKVLGIPQVV
jgi:hypothetical protein